MIDENGNEFFDMSEPTINIEAMAFRIAEIKAEMEAAKPLYDELEVLIVTLARAGVKRVPLTQGDELVIVDNFESKNTVFRSAGVSRFGATVETPADKEKALVKSAKAAKKRRVPSLS